MRNALLALAALAAVAGCSATERGAAIGGIGGAAIGGAASDSVGGAVAGGAVGAVAGALIGKASEPGRCIYRDRHGRRYTGRCP